MVWDMQTSELGEKSDAILEEVVLAFNKLKSIPGRANRDLCLTAMPKERNLQLILSYDNNIDKYYLTIQESNEIYALADRSLPSVEIDAVIGGQTISEDQQHLVCESMAYNALIYFFEYGRRLSDFDWDKY